MSEKQTPTKATIQAAIEAVNDRKEISVHIEGIRGTARFTKNDDTYLDNQFRSALVESLIELKSKLPD